MIGNGLKISFWFDTWLGTENLADQLDLEIHPDDFHVRLGEILDSEGNWNFDSLHTVIPENVKRWLQISGLFTTAEEDKAVWKATISGQLTATSAYMALKSINHPGGRTGNWKWIWKIKSSNKLKHFLWLCVHDRLPTNKLRHSRHIAESSLCEICQKEEESTLHVILTA